MTGASENQPDDTTSITAGTEREAMDWSLVLLSQGIESTLLRDEASGSWRLLIPAALAGTSRDSIARYEQENRAWPLRRPLPWPGVSFDWTALAWAVLMLVFFWLQSRPGSALVEAGVCDLSRVRAGEWWRLVTATTLHADVGHLAGNLVFGILLLGLALGRFGAGLGLLAATLAGVAGNALGFWWYAGPHGSLGASGVVLAAVGMLAADTALQQWRQRQPRRFVLATAMAGVMLFLLLGVAPRSDMAAHTGGLMAGAVFGGALGALPMAVTRKGWLNALAGSLTALLVMLAWWLALRA